MSGWSARQSREEPGMSDLPEAAGRVWGGSWLGHVVASRRPGAGGGGVEGDRRVAAPVLGFLLP